MPDLPVPIRSYTSAAEGVDLRALVRAVGRVGAAPSRSTTPRPVVEIVDPDLAPIVGDPVPVVGYLDGCQASRILTYREHRPLVLWWAAAAVVAPGRPLRCLGLAEAVALSCSYVDGAWAASLPGGVPVEAVDAVAPWEVEAAIANVIDDRRRTFEIGLSAEVAAGVGVVLVDGDLRAKPHRPDLVACAKTFDGVYLADESSVFSLAEGWRSPIMRLPAMRQSEADRYSAYVRLFDATHDWWGFGLVRIETRAPSLIDGVAALCVANRQPLGIDRRENQLASIAAVEAFLKSRRPPLFTMH
jgi:hypothetical protein